MPTTYDNVAISAVAPLRVRLFDMLSALSTTLDLLAPAMSTHQKRTCLIAARIARQLQLQGDAYRGVYIAAMLHDIGALAPQERMSILAFDAEDPHLHARLGARLLERFDLFAAYAPLIDYHHVPWNQGGNPEVPPLSQLIHLADRIEVLVRSSDNILDECGTIRSTIQSLAGSKFHPGHVDAFLQISQTESFWLDIHSFRLDRQLRELAPFADEMLDIEHLMPFARFFALIIDSRSHFTATHSAGVAICAATLARYLGMSLSDIARMRVAGYLHDTGKLAVPNEYINRKDTLSRAEMAQVRAHSYLTRDILGGIEGLSELVEWAADHHERLDGSGYPFHKTGEQLTAGARIMAVADVYTAMTEDRPYRAGLAPHVALRLIKQQGAAGKLDLTVLATLERHQEEIVRLCRHHEAQEGQEMEAFWQLAAQRDGLSGRETAAAP